MTVVLSWLAAHYMDLTQWAAAVAGSVLLGVVTSAAASQPGAFTKWAVRVGYGTGVVVLVFGSGVAERKLWQPDSMHGISMVPVGLTMAAGVVLFRVGNTRVEFARLGVRVGTAIRRWR